MSRSYRKLFITHQSHRRGGTVKWFKRDANKRVRRFKDLPNGNAYKKVYPTWDICDYKCLIDEDSWWMDEPWKVLSK